MASVTETSLGSLPAKGSLAPSSAPQKQTGTSTPVTTPSEAPKPEFYWMVKPCFLYKEEYKDCKSFKARFHQYFVNGKSSECQHWKDDYDNCLLWEEKNNMEGLRKVIESEKKRVRERLRSHYSNDVWEHRTSPPTDWNNELPDSIKKEYENSFLKKKSEELKNGTEKLGNFRGDGDMDLSKDDEPSSCSIM